MNAKYYRFLYQNIEGGICHTGCITDTYEKKDYNFIYISGLKDNSPGDGSLKDEKVLAVKQYKLVVLADFCVYSVRKLVRILKHSKVLKAVLPKCEPESLKQLVNDKVYSEEEISFLSDPYVFLKNAGVGEICEVEKNTSFICNDWQFTIAAVGEGTEKSLIMYHGSYHMDKTLEDCVMTVKCFTNQEACEVCIEPDKSSCGMRCVLYNDFDICKKHNGPEADSYIDGTLLLGTANLRKYLDGILSLLSDVLKKIRFVVIPDGGNDEEWDSRLLEIGTTGYKQYFIVPTSDCDNGGALKDIGLSSPYQQLIATSGEYGLCCSGFYKHREDK